MSGSETRRRLSRQVPDLGRLLGPQSSKKGWSVCIEDIQETPADDQESRRDASGTPLDPAMIWSLLRHRR